VISCSNSCILLPPRHQTLCLMLYVMRSHNLLCDIMLKLVYSCILLPPRHQTLCVLPYVVCIHHLLCDAMLKFVNYLIKPCALCRMSCAATTCCVMPCSNSYDFAPTTSSNLVRYVVCRAQPRPRVQDGARGAGGAASASALARRRCVVYGQRHWLRPRNRTAQGARG